MTNERLRQSIEQLTKDTAAEWQSGYDAGIEAAANALEAENERLREHLISALDTLKDAEICNDECGPCNEARAALEQSQ
jgi:hypothetical protein